MRLEEVVHRPRRFLEHIFEDADVAPKVTAGSQCSSIIETLSMRRLWFTARVAVVCLKLCKPIPAGKPVPASRQHRGFAIRSLHRTSPACWATLGQIRLHGGHYPLFELTLMVGLKYCDSASSDQKVV